MRLGDENDMRPFVNNFLIIDLSKEIEKLYTIIIDNHKMKVIWIETLNQHKLEIAKRISEGLFEGKVLLRAFDKMFEIINRFRDIKFKTNNNFYKVANLMKQELKQLSYQLIKDYKFDNKIFVPILNSTIFRIIEIFTAKVLKESIIESNFYYKRVLYVTDFNFILINELTKIVDAIYYHSNLYFKEKEIIQKIHVNAFEVDSINQLDSKTSAVLLNDSNNDYNKTEISISNDNLYSNIKNDRQLVCYSFNYIEELMTLDLDMIQSFYHEPNYFNNNFNTKVELIEHYQKIKRLTKNKTIIFNLFRFDIIKYALNIDDDSLTKNELTKYFNLFKDDLEVIIETFNSEEIKFLLPYVETPQDFLGAKQLIEQLTDKKLKLGLGIEIDEAVINYENFKQFSFSVLNLERFMEEYYGISDFKEKSPNQFQLKTINDLHVLSSRKHKEDYIMGVSLIDENILKIARNTRFNHIILNKQQIKRLLKFK